MSNILNANGLTTDQINTYKANYNKILWILDNMYVPAKSDEDQERANKDKTTLLSNAGISSNFFNIITDDDIEVIQQLAIWYYTNFDEVDYNSENILANALGHALDTSKHKINSTASYLSTHEEERVADIEITYTQGIDKQVLLDSKSSLDNFHIGEIKNLQERAETARTKLNMTKPMSPTNYEQFAYDILTKQYSLVDVEITETVVKSDAFGHIVDLQAVYRVSQDDLDYFSAELLKNKYQNLSHPLLFVTPNGQAVKTLSQVLTDLKTGIGTVQLNNLSSSSTTVNKKVDSEYNEGLEELRKQGDNLIQKKLNVISLWYGKPTRVKD
jgi:hypothetical protein